MKEFISEYFHDKDYGIYTPPVTSSGDIYHIAAYIILCAEHNLPIPTVYLGADTNDTKTHARRGKNFLNLLGFNKCEILYLTDTNCYRSNKRDKEIEEKLNEQGIEIANQKITTALISSSFKKYGYGTITKLIQKHLLNIGNEQNKIHINEWVQNKLNLAKEKFDSSKFCVLHHRIPSNNVNDQQSLENEELKKIIEILESNQINVLILVVADMMPKKFNLSQYLHIHVFEAKPPISPDYDKFCHIHLLNGLSQLTGFEGIIGGTSGTLDTAAFMGIKVLNIHKFKLKAEKKYIMGSQDFRILLQTNFMSVCQNVNKDLIETWLTNHYSLVLDGQLCSLYEVPENDSIKSEEEKHKHYKDRVPFIFCSALKKHSDTETITRRSRKTMEVRVLNLVFDKQKSLVLEYFNIAELYKRYIEHKKIQEENYKEFTIKKNLLLSKLETGKNKDELHLVGLEFNNLTVNDKDNITDNAEPRGKDVTHLRLSL